MTGRPTKVITSEQAEDAVYLDFEGNMDRAPSLLGVLVGERLMQFVVEPDLFPMARYAGSASVSGALDLDSALAAVDEAVGDHRLVLAYTWHDRSVIERYAAPRTAASWAPRMVNAKLVADRWVNSGRAEPPAAWVNDGTLRAYQRLIGYRVPVAQGTNVAGPGLQRVRAALATGGSPDTLTPGTKRHWTRLVSHNRHDLLSLRELCLAAAQQP